MRRFLLPTICLLFIFSACKKKTDIAPANTVSATVDGVNMNFNTNVVAHFVNNQETAGTSSLIIQGVTAAQTPSGGIGISLTSTNANYITEGTYTATSYKNTPPVWIQVSYVSSGDLDQPFWTDPNTIKPTTITITSITNTNVQGTFNGTLVYSQGGAPTKTVTNGKFNVTIQ